jgi:hypothetical protein
MYWVAIKTIIHEGYKTSSDENYDPNVICLIPHGRNMSRVTTKQMEKRRQS